MKRLNKYWLLACIFMILAFSSLQTFAASLPSVQLKVDKAASKLKVELKDVPSGTSSLQLSLTLEGVNGYESALWPSNLENDYKYINVKPNEEAQRLTLYVVSHESLPQNLELTLLLSTATSSWDAKNSVDIKYLDETLKETTLENTLATVIYTSSDSDNNGSDNNNNNNNNNNKPDNNNSNNNNKPNKDKNEDKQPSTPVVPVPTPLLPNVSFTDIHSHWAEASILRMAAKGLITGYPDGTFKPSATTTRNEFATIIAKSFTLEYLGTPIPFSDIKEEAWYTSNVMALYERGIITGLAPRTFGGSNFMTNEQMITILYRTLDHLDITLPSERVYVPFVDEKQISSYALEAVKALYEAGLVNGLEGHTFGPHILATRAQVATVLDRVLALIESK